MSEIELFIHKCLAYAKHQKNCLILNSNGIEAAMGLNNYEFIFLCGKKDQLKTSENSALLQLQHFIERNQGQWMGISLTYDLKNEIEQLHSNNNDQLHFPLLNIFVPENVICIDKNLTIICNNAAFLETIHQQDVNEKSTLPHITLTSKVTKEAYLENVKKIQQHILDGDVYEVNYCIEFYKEQCADLEPVAVYKTLNTCSPTPYSALWIDHEHFIACASPERFLLKKGRKIFSQPIKGTIKRKTDLAADAEQKALLLNSEKERAENLMIVDLVRNDLSRSSETGSIRVDELFGIYSFKNLHQMISTVSGSLIEENLVTVIKNAFPMGSMTGAPKIKAMEIIENLEQTRRGMYSGSIGYINPAGDFDLNVVIRSLQYNSANQYLNFEVGSAITIDSDPESEYNECLLKGETMMQIFKHEG
jgi:para-aminobenzoate synthetase component 1